MSFSKPQVSFSLNFASLFSVMKHNSSQFFFSAQRYTSFKRIPLKCKFWDFLVLASKFVKSLLSMLKLQASSSSDFASFFIVMTHNSSVNVKLIIFLFWTKGPLQSFTFEAFKCSSENLPYSSCHFRNHESVCFFQILHHSSVSWE